MESFLRLAHVARFLGIEKHVLRKWSNQLEPLASRPSRERSAIEFSSADLLFLEAVRLLVVDLGMRLDSVASFSAALHDAVQRPFPTDVGTQLVVCRTLDGRWSIGESPSEPAILLALPLGEIQNRAFSALGVSEQSHQRELALGLVDTAIHRRPSTR